MKLGETINKLPHCGNLFIVLVEPKVKENLEDIFSELGLNMTFALNLFFK